MSLFSTIIVPQLEKGLSALEPQIAEFLLEQVQSIGSELLLWAEKKLNIPHQEEDVPQ